jgi:hypothetical protein
MCQVGLNKISKGDVGTVTGPCDDMTLPDKADRMVVEFEGQGRANFLKSQVEHASGKERRGGAGKGEMDPLARFERPVVELDNDEVEALELLDRSQVGRQSISKILTSRKARQL